MIMARSPLRISLGGGGTDLPSYYEQFGGFLIAGAIDRHVYVNLSRRLAGGIRVVHETVEDAAHIDQVAHPMVREALRGEPVDPEGLCFTCSADLPSGTGLGSSGSFGTALYAALDALAGRISTPESLAQRAAALEIERLGLPVGKQDQYAAAFGGITAFSFAPGGEVVAERVAVGEATRAALGRQLLLFFTGFRRSAAAVLAPQDRMTRAGDQAMLDNLHRVRQIGLESRRALEAGRLGDFGALLDEHWQVKQARSPGATLPAISEAYDLAKRSGAIGGKVVGAGGGGFLLFLAEDPDRLRGAMARLGLPEVRFAFTERGTEVLAT